MQKLKKQLQRELKTNPKKAAFLGLLAVVALWFWAPLVYGWLPKGSQPVAQPGAPAPPAAPAAPSAVPAAAVPPSAPGGQTVRPSWRLLSEWIEKDPYMQPATWPAGKADPFRRETPAPQVRETASTAPPKPELPRVTPQSAGLVLTSTVVGPNRGTAVINGKAYSTGRSVPADSGGNVVLFELAEVHPGFVVLRNEDQQYRLKIEKPDRDKVILFAD